MTKDDRHPDPAGSRPLMSASTILMTAIVAGGLLLALIVWRIVDPPDPQVTFSSQEVLAEVEELGHLVAMKVHIAEVLTAEKGSSRALFKIHGDASLAIDVRSLSGTNIDEHDKTITLSLPDPQVMSPRVDHSRSEMFDYKSSIWSRWVRGTVNDQNDITNVAYAHAQEAIEAAAGKDSHIQEARGAAEKVLNQMFSAKGWQVKVKWPKHPES